MVKNDFPIDEAGVVTYKAKEKRAHEMFRSDSALRKERGVVPESERWMPDKLSGGTIFLNLLFGSLTLVVGALMPFVGWLLFLGFLAGLISMFVGERTGDLIVTYVKEAPVEPLKTCPACAEEVKLLANVCKHCGNEFKTMPQK